MRHLNSGRKLNRSGSHRKALMRNLATALIRHEQIRTTDAKAKELRRFADRLVSLGKQATLHARRRAFDRIRDSDAVSKLFDVIAPRFGDRPGGYTRIVKLGLRHGDAAPISIIEWTGRGEEGKKKGKGKRKPAEKAPAKQAAPRKRAAAG
ncbi:MAG TPA: 50S ribosomal protein L17 [Candidatus Binatia bacterium]|nr:50S ribosomal protein L17 [Candidatus Binatia bacterium]